MNLFGRLRNINKTKNYYFLGLYVPTFGYINAIIDKNVLKYSLNIGDLLYFDYEYIKNNEGKDIIRIINITEIVKNNIGTFKESSRNNANLNNFINSFNGNNQLKVYNIYVKTLKYLRDYFNDNHFQEVTGNVLEMVPTSSFVPYFETQSNNSPNHYYLRITTENSLKQTTMMTLKSSYSLGPVFYDKKGKMGEQQQVITLEFVSIDWNHETFIDFIRNYINTIVQFANDEHLNIQKLKDPLVLDYNYVTKKIPDFGPHHIQNTDITENLIVLNVPNNSPFIREIDGNKTETQWYLHGKMVAHAYNDENDYKKRKAAVDLQAIKQDKIFYNTMSYFQYGLPFTYSGGLGIEKSMQHILGLNNMISMQNPLGNDACENELIRKRRKK